MKYLFLIGSILILSLYGIDDISVGIKDDNKNKVESGWRFGDKSLQDEKKKKDEKEILAELLGVAKEQLKTQKEILKLLKNKIDPEPEKMTLADGTECIVNSSKECFKMPVTDEAKKTPVLAKLISDPTIKNAIEYQKWQGRYFNEVFDVANALQLAIAQKGTEAYPTNFSRASFDSTIGYNSALRTKSNTYLLNTLQDKFSLFIFFGKNADMDMYAFDAYADLIKDLENIEVTVVFATYGSKEVFVDAAKTFINLRRMLERSNVVVGEQYFKKFNIYATPTLMVQDKVNNEANAIVVGRTGKDNAQDKIIDLLEYKKILEPGHSSDYKAWERVGDYSEDYLKMYYNVDVNKTYIEAKYKE